MAKVLPAPVICWVLRAPLLLPACLKNIQAVRLPFTGKKSNFKEPVLYTYSELYSHKIRINENQVNQFNGQRPG